MQIYICIHIYISWLTVVEGEPKALFSITTNRSVRKSATLFPGLLHLPLIHTL